MKVSYCSFGNVSNMQSFTFASPHQGRMQKQQPKMKRKQWDEEKHAIEKLLSIAVWTHTHNFSINRIIHHHLHLNCLVLGTFFREENNKIRLFKRYFQPVGFNLFGWKFNYKTQHCLLECMSRSWYQTDQDSKLNVNIWNIRVEIFP